MGGPRRRTGDDARLLAWLLTEPYDRAMGGRINLADPSFEPTDEQLQELSRRAFAGVAAANARALAKLRAQIGNARQEALRALEQRREGKVP